MTDRPTPYPHPRKGDVYRDPAGRLCEVKRVLRIPGSETHRAGTIYVEYRVKRRVERREFEKWTLIEEES